MYGIPHGWGANLLMYNTDVVKGAPGQLGVRCSPPAPPRNTRARSPPTTPPIYIADAALYLSKTKPELGIKNPYSLTEDQLNAAVDLLKAQHGNIGEYWSDYTKAVQAFESGTSVIGTTWQVIAT